MLTVEKINTFYGDSHILFDVDLTIAEGEVVSLLGRNGAGKTTTLRSIMGLTPPRAGSVRWLGEEVHRLKPHEIARKGLGFVPEDRRIFSRLSVEENLEIGAFKLEQPSSWTLERIYGLFPKLEQLKAHKGNQLSGGEQQMLAIARALMGAPKLVLLDEPSEGLAPAIVKDVGEMIGTLKDEGIAVLLVEQNTRFACRLSDRVYIIDNGRVRFGGTVAELEADEELKSRYLAV
ncbi:MAG: ABC transporter ATP-binding protein [Nitrospinae bacterium]|nr:ABC transporter ATP-binding protein [Nitrospinota bacterium]